MLHRCEQCDVVYLVSEHSHLCNYCGQRLQEQIQKLSEYDGAVEWWQVACQVASGEQPERAARWRIG